MIFITSAAKRAIEDHFDTHFELEYTLKQKKQQALLDMVTNIVPKGVHCIYVRQPEALGLGHAVLCAESVVGDEPFAVLLADDLIDSKPTPCLQQMCAYYDRHKNSVVAVQSIAPEDSEKYGVVAIEPHFQGQGTISAIVEKPAPAVAPSSFGVVGRYILTPAIMRCLRETAKGKGGEIQLTDAIAQLLIEEPVHAFAFSGTRYDCGSKLGYLMATVSYGLQHPELGHAFGEYLRGR